MPSDRPFSMDGSPPSGKAFDTPYKTGNQALGDRLPADAAQVKTWRDVRAQQRNAPETPEAEALAMTGPFDLFHNLSASPVPQQAQEQDQAARTAAVQPPAGMPLAGMPPAGLQEADLPQAVQPQMVPPQAVLPESLLPETPLSEAMPVEAMPVEAAGKATLKPAQMPSPAPMTAAQPQLLGEGAEDAPLEAAQPRNAPAQAGAAPAETRQGEAGNEAGTNSLARPMDLFHTVPVARPAETVDPMALSATLQHSLVEMATRLLVSDGSNGQRRVQIEVADDKLPGVVVDVFEDEGRLVTRFTCSDESSRERLCSEAAWLADSLVERLQRDSRVQVQTDDPEDPYLLQVDANV